MSTVIYQKLLSLSAENLEWLNQQPNIDEIINQLVATTQNYENCNLNQRIGCFVTESAVVEELDIAREQIKTLQQQLNDYYEQLESEKKANLSQLDILQLQCEKLLLHNNYQKRKYEEQFEISQEIAKTLYQQLKDEIDCGTAYKEKLKIVEKELHTLLFHKLTNKIGEVNLLQQQLEVFAQKVVLQEKGKNGKLLIQTENRLVVISALKRFIALLLH